MAQADPRRIGAKIGRNDPCWCSSGKKYKKCHLQTDLSQPAHPAGPPVRVPPARPVQGRPKIDVVHQGQRVRAVGNRLYFRPPQETFHEFIINIILKLALGKEWYMGEVARVPEERHELVRWFFAFGDFTKQRMSEEYRRGEQLWASDTTGMVQALVTLAYDVYQLEHGGGGLPEPLLKRLKSRDGFQGARYEIAVAATFVGMGWTIEWIEDKSVKHCEFVARDPSREFCVGVEAKSRHRPGVIHQPGTLDLEKAARGDVDRLFREALAQAPEGIPFIVFVDLNIPPTETPPAWDSPLMADLRRILDAYGTPTPTAPDPYTALILTSYPWHYARDGSKAPGGKHLSVIPKHSRHPLPMAVLEYLVQALKKYGRVPPENADG